MFLGRIKIGLPLPQIPLPSQFGSPNPPRSGISFLLSPAEDPFVRLGSSQDFSTLS